MECKIKIKDLRAAVDALLSHIENDLRIDDISLDKDYYWEICSGRYNMSLKPSDIGVGQLYEDWGFLRSIVDDPETAVPLNLLHAAALLRYIAEVSSFEFYSK